MSGLWFWVKLTALAWWPAITAFAVRWNSEGPSDFNAISRSILHSRCVTSAWGLNRERGLTFFFLIIDRDASLIIKPFGCAGSFKKRKRVCFFPLDSCLNLNNSNFSTGLSISFPPSSAALASKFRMSRILVRNDSLLTQLKSWQQPILDISKSK